MAKACEVFPEYADAINSDNISANSRTRSLAADEVVYTETRSLSDTESITLSQMSSGNVIVISRQESSSYLDININSSNTSDITTVGVSGTVTFTVAMSFIANEYFTLSNVGFIIYYNGNHYFNNPGTVIKSSGVMIGEESISTTYINYPLTFLQYPYLVDLRLYFNNDQLVIFA